MAAPMSFLPRVIIGATTFTVVVAGAFYLYYRSRYIFSRKRPSDSTSEEEGNDEQNREAIIDEPEHRKVTLQSCTDASVVGLIHLLETEEDESYLCRVLTTIANKAAFTEGQNAVRQAGGLPVITRQLERCSERVQTCTASCIANLSLNKINQPLLKACIPTLLQLAAEPRHTLGLRLACVQALVNLSVSGQCGGHFSRPSALQTLSTLLGDGTSAVGQQALRVLVNLSADETVTPALLSFDVPDGFLHLLETHHTDESLLRTLSFLINLKRASFTTPPETVAQSSPSDNGLSFAQLFAERSGELTVAVDALMRHGKADVKQQAGRLATMLSGP